ncbi:T9SS type A sorting domain-containing protein [Flavobacterium sp.]|uniref:T9SS type A sorting domain-containing protein n=1 Tax=Flavobacterium sp. TaxID=239 RepID=UPI002B4B1C52|nr:T9SS type A sorting domain-containing protein [Flavobacterium sp.]HLP62912.1 T9SS type A sorting domain-containing protein [Flavobacterium sp.]
MKKNLHSFLITITLLICTQAFSTPVISAVSVSNITPTSARINFSVNAQNSTTYAFVQINTIPTMSGSYPPNGPFNGTTPAASFQDVTNLIPNTLYYYAIDAYDASSQAAVTVTGTFTTGGTVPSTTNAVVSNITSTSAQIDFEVNTFGIQSSIVVDYGLSPTFFYSYNWVANTFTNTPTPFSFNFVELTPNTTYYYSVGSYSPTLTGNRILGSFTTSVLSNSDHEQKLNFSLSPNPASDYFTIEMENEIQSVEIYSLQGQKVVASVSKSINVSDLSSGIYLVRIEDQNHAVATQKLIIE